MALEASNSEADKLLGVTTNLKPQIRIWEFQGWPVLTPTCTVLLCPVPDTSAPSQLGLFPSTAGWGMCLPGRQRSNAEERGPDDLAEPGGIEPSVDTRELLTGSPESCVPPGQLGS